MISGSSGLTTAQINGSINTTAATYTPTFISGSSNDATTTIGTVGAGKKWTIIGVRLCHSSTAGDGLTMITTTGTVMTLLKIVSKGLATYGNATPSDGWILPKERAPILNAGDTIVMTGSGSSIHAWTVIYIEESV